MRQLQAKIAVAHLRERVNNGGGDGGNGGGGDKMRTSMATEIDGEREWNKVRFEPVLTLRKYSVDTCHAQNGHGNRDAVPILRLACGRRREGGARARRAKK